MAKGNLKIVSISVISALVLSSTILSSILVRGSYAQVIQATPVPSDPHPGSIKFVSSGLYCGPGQPKPYLRPHCINATQPTGVALAQQTNDILTGLSIGNDGAMYVTFKVGVGKWSTVGISPKGIFRSGSGSGYTNNIAMAKQTDNLLTALAVDGYGALRVSWVVGTGQWQGPVSISESQFAPPGAGIALAKRTDNLLTALTVGNNGALYASEVVVTGKMDREVSPIPISQPNFAPSGAGVALARQTNNQLTALTVGNNGALYVSWVVGNGKWEGPVPISQPNFAPPGVDVAIAQQADNQLTALTVGNNGALYVSWVVGNGKWEGPVPISQPNIFPPGAPIAMAKQTNNQLTALTVGNNGALYVSWVVGNGKWEGPVPISQPKIFAPRAGIAMTYFTGARALEALIVGPVGGLYVSWVVGTGKWQGPVRIY